MGSSWNFIVVVNKGKSLQYTYEGTPEGFTCNLKAFSPLNNEDQCGVWDLLPIDYTQNFRKRDRLP